MATYLLTWNPAKWQFEDWAGACADMTAHGFFIHQWACANSHAAIGDAVLLKKTGRGLTGIIASGEIIAAPYLNGHWDKGKDRVLKQYVLVRFSRLADYTKGEIMPVNKTDLGYTPQPSGCVLSDNKAAALLARFQAYVAAPVIAPLIIDPIGKKREPISPRLRWMILDRDAHTCRYCGRSAPTVVLHVDHIVSQKNWPATHDGLVGVNDPANLVTSCSECNLGKSAENGNPPALYTIQ
jgi:hypothetical protein